MKLWRIGIGIYLWPEYQQIDLWRIYSRTICKLFANRELCAEHRFFLISIWNINLDKNLNWSHQQTKHWFSVYFTCLIPSWIKIMKNGARVKKNTICIETEISSAELLKRMDTQTHVHAKKNSRICAKFWLLNAKLAKEALFHDFGANWIFFIQIFYVFRTILVQTSAQKYNKLKFVRAKLFIFRRSAVLMCWLYKRKWFSNGPAPWPCIY